MKSMLTVTQVFSQSRLPKRREGETTESIPDKKTLDRLFQPLCGAAEQLSLFSVDPELRALFPGKSSAELVHISMLTADGLARDPLLARALSLPTEIMDLTLTLDAAIGQLQAAANPLRERAAAALLLLDAEICECVSAIEEALDQVVNDPQTGKGDLQVLAALFAPGQRLLSHFLDTQVQRPHLEAVPLQEPVKDAA